MSSVKTKLSKQEMVVFQLLVDYDGDYKQIASKLVISESTVKTHITGIYQKLFANTKLQAVLIGLREGLIQLDSTKQTTSPDREDHFPVCIFL